MKTLLQRIKSLAKFTTIGVETIPPSDYHPLCNQSSLMRFINPSHCSKFSTSLSNVFVYTWSSSFSEMFRSVVFLFVYFVMFVGLGPNAADAVCLLFLWATPFGFKFLKSKCKFLFRSHHYHVLFF